MTTQADLTRAKYSGRDFWTFFDDLKKKLQDEYGDDYNDFVESAVGVMLLDVMSYVADTLSFYLDRQAVESYMATALTRTGVERLARQLGYKMYGAVSGSVDLTVTLNQAWGFDVTVPEGFKFQGPNDLIFEAAQDVLYPASDVGPKTISAREGETKSQVYVSDGTKNQEYELGGVPDGQYVVLESVEVVVGSDPWSEVEFLEFEQTKQFEVGYGAAPPKIRFGDGVAGNIPDSGTEIRVTYVVGSGKAGFAGSDTIDDVVSPLRVSGNEIDMTVTNDEPSSGASDGETILRAKRNAPGYFRARDVAVTKGDIESLSNSFTDPQFGAVAVAQAFSIRSAASDGNLNTELATIRDTVDDPVPTVQAEVASIEANMTEVAAQVAGIDTLADDIDSEASGANSNMAAATSDMNACSNKQDVIKVNAADIQAYASDVDSEVNDIGDDINAITTGGSDGLTAGTKSTLLAYLTTINQKTALIDTEAGNVVSDANGAKTDCDNAVSDIQAGQARMTTIAEKVVEVKTDTAAITTEAGEVQIHLDTIEAAVVDPAVTVNEACDEIYSHVDALLSDDCKANLVEVPILTLDPDGFYIGPSIALINSLQVYLDARKEPTVTIKVYSGEEAVVEVDVDIELGVSSGVVKPKAVSTAQSIVEGLLKGRVFGASLYKSQVTDALMDGVDGLEWVNVTMSYESLVNAKGNLVISALQVISKGDVTIEALDA